MSIYSYKGFTPQLANGVFIAPSADLIGQVSLEENVNIWYQCVVRGDVNKICIGKNTNIQDLSVLHVTEENALTIGEGVSVGHSVTLHACTVENNCLIGMGAVVLDGAVIGANSIVAAGSLVPPGKIYPAGSMILGNPAIVKRALTPKELETYGNHYKSYLNYKDEFLDSNLVKLV